ncbi:SDR family NAD(P)-dependent oxidoreductase [Mucilaginibacter inviolabilis]|uniref:SDR family NAD(P)-dependent oxidoreductase n=1 Tax=Mucilaginibacter inviolabilis TaxID=2714892 RepID=UPI001934232A|nr:SDR family NAD(P)-dependent oxidoreductase [Mucilaginibacter inviolabilis]
MQVILADNRQQNIEAVADAIHKKGGQAACFTADISREEDVSLLMNFTLQTYDKLDILVNNAGVMDSFTPVAEVSNELWEKVIGVNLNGPFYTCRSAVRLFLNRAQVLLSI